MKLRFSVHYRTEWGQQLTILLTYQQQDGQQRHSRVEMQTEDGDLWHAETAAVDSRRVPIISFSYKYYC